LSLSIVDEIGLLPLDHALAYLGGELLVARKCGRPSLMKTT
jgi:hypothetical protein